MHAGAGAEGAEEGEHVEAEAEGAEAIEQEEEISAI